MDACFTCEVNAGRIAPPGGTIYADDLWIADHGIPALVRGYVVLKPKRHVRDLADLTVEEASALGVAAQRVSAAVRSALSPERIYVCAFVEAVPHLHFHLLPRYSDMPPLGPRLVEPLFGEKWAVTEEVAEEAASRIRAALETHSN
jgi:diadenosine tetraphosphate (Ap4A) HIT family hydrolase